MHLRMPAPVSPPCRRALVCVVVTLVIFPASALAQEAPPGLLVTSVDAYKLMDHMGYGRGEVRVGRQLVRYAAKGDRRTPVGIGVGVHPSHKAAREAYAALMCEIPIGPSLSETGGEVAVAVWYSEPGHYGHALLLFRNLVLSVHPQRARSARAVADAAHGLLEFAVCEPGVVGWGDCVQPPEVRLSVHGEPLAGLELRIAYRAQPRRPVRVARGWLPAEAVGVRPMRHLLGLEHRPRDVPGEPDFREQGELSFSPQKAGQCSMLLLFADAGNVLFPKTVDLRVADPAQLPPTAQRKWVVPGDTLYTSSRTPM